MNSSIKIQKFEDKGGQKQEPSKEKKKGKQEPQDQGKEKAKPINKTTIPK